jgi:hypothetical protein
MGKYLGANASPEFAEYIRTHPEMGVEYRSPETNPIADMVWTIGGQASMYIYGVNFSEALDDLSGTRVNDGLYTEEDRMAQQGGDGSMTDWFNPYAFMGSRGGSSNDNEKSTTTQRTSTSSNPTKSTSSSYTSSKKSSSGGNIGSMLSNFSKGRGKKGSGKSSAFFDNRRFDYL